MRKYLRPNMSLHKHAGQIAAPIAPGPPDALLEKVCVVGQRSLDFDLWMVLHVGFPAVRHHPAGDEVVIVRIELVLAEPPPFIGEGVGKCRILEDFGAIGDGPARHAGDAAVDVGGGCTVKVSAFEVQCAKEAPNALGERWVLLAP